MIKGNIINRYFNETVAALRQFIGPKRAPPVPVNTHAELQRFLVTRANYVSQFSLYGYLRTRTGVRFPELFADDVFVRSINIAKWHLWLACLADLTVYAGRMIASRAPSPGTDVAPLMKASLDAVLAEVGAPPDAGEEFDAHAQRVRARIALTDWRSFVDDESSFSESPDALVQYAPVIEELKILDAEIVRNSVRFRWHEVRRDLRRDLDAAALLSDRPQA